jgi:hypothetical protein
MPAAVVGVSMGLFAISAVIEGAATVAVFGALERMNPRWIQARGAERTSRTRGALAAAAVLLGSLGALAASSLPDGLESLAERIGIAGRARTLFETPLLDYELQWVQAGWLRKTAAGLAGLAAIYGVCVALARLIRRRRSA